MLICVCLYTVCVCLYLYACIPCVCACMCMPVYRVCVFVCVYLYTVCVLVYCVCSGAFIGQKKASNSQGLDFTGSCEPPCECWESNCLSQSILGGGGGGGEHD